MANLKIKDSVIRDWAVSHNVPIGSRGRVSAATVQAYVDWHEKPLRLQIAELEAQLRDARAENSENSAIIRAQQQRIRDLETQVADLRQLAAQGAMAIYS